MKDIRGFFGEYQYLSNFWYCDVYYDGQFFPTSEHAFVYAKVDPDDPSLEQVYEDIVDLTPAQVKRYGRNITLRENWDKIKFKVMAELVYDKFTRNPDLQRKLLDTGDCYIEETNTWNDRIWGVCKGEGKNALGRIIMNTRERIKLEQLFS